MSDPHPARAADHDQADHRIKAIDGLRGIAIISVISYHYLYFIQSMAAPSYMRQLGLDNFFRYGNLGVPLFFAISGFVISQTLRRTNGCISFAWKRFARLFPAMALCSLMTFAVIATTSQRSADLALRFLPSLTFSDPRIFNAILHRDDIQWMDGVYWSLFTEVRFYAIAAALYFTSKRLFVRNFFLMAGCVGLLFPLAIVFRIDALRSFLNYLFIANELPWFTFGVGCYLLHQGRVAPFVAFLLQSAIAMSLYAGAMAYSPYMVFEPRWAIIGMAGIYPMFVLALKWPPLTRLMSGPLISAIGAASYSLYLLHQEIGYRAILAVDGTNLLAAPYSLLVPVAIALGFVSLSLAIYRYFERPLNRRLNHWRAWASGVAAARA